VSLRSTNRCLSTAPAAWPTARCGRISIANGAFLPDAALGFDGSHWTGSASSTETQVGWALGAGVEWAPASMPNWSFKAEYLYVDLGSTTVNLSAAGFRNSHGEGFRTVTASNTMDARFQTVRLGVNYHFN